MAALGKWGSGCCPALLVSLIVLMEPCRLQLGCNDGTMWASTEIRDWNGLMPNCAHLYNAYRDRKSKDPDERMKVPQAFTFLRREGRAFCNHSPSCSHFSNLPHFFLADLPGHGDGMVTEERVPKRLRVAGNSRDIFALVKMNMSDDHLSQDPLLVYPAGLEASTLHFWRTINQSAKKLYAELDDDRKGELSKLAAAFKNDFPHLQRAVNYYGSLMDDNRPRQTPPVLRFVEAGPHAGSRVGVVELGQRPPPPKPFHLKVKFHRG